MLRKFSSIADCGIFQNFHWSPATPNFERINLIYGPNGSGKTSLANALEDLSSDAIHYSKVSISMSNADQTNIRESKQQNDPEFKRLFIFGDDYIKRNLNFDDETNSTVNAVLTVGQRTIDQEARVAELEPLIGKTEIKLNRARQKSKAAAERLDKHYLSIAQKIVAALSRAGGQYRSNSTYSKKIARERFEGSHADWLLLPEKDIQSDLATINSDEKKAITPRTYSFRVRAELVQEVANVLEATPIAVVLDTLADHPEATNWVDEGRHLHDGMDQCLFCGSQLTNARKQQIERHFSDEVTKVQNIVEALIKEVESDQEQLRSLLGDGTIVGSLFSDLQDHFNTAHAKAREQVKTLNGWLDEVLSVLQKKGANPLSSVTFTSSMPPSVNGSDIENTVKSHNTRVSEHASNVLKAAKRLELSFLKESEAEIKQLTKALDDAMTDKREIDQSLNGEDGYRTELARLKSSVGDPLPSAKSMTHELTRILGRDELSFSLLPDGKHYAVTRYGRAARNLSTGERTAIALIHFLEYIKHSATDIGKPIVIIDDPISSLDRGVAMGISTYIWSETVASEDTEQVFLLTHSFELFRQWDIQIDGLRGERGPKNKCGYTSNTYELLPKYHRTDDGFIRVPNLRAWPTNENVRKKVRSSYHHAFMTAAFTHNELIANSSMENKLDATLLYPNVLRRILETFLAFKAPAHNNGFAGAMRDMGAKLESTGYTGDGNALRLQLTRFTHAYSHADSPETNTVINPDEIGPTITAVFTFMNAIDQEHFHGLCKIAGVEPDQLLYGLKQSDYPIDESNRR